MLLCEYYSPLRGWGDTDSVANILGNYSDVSGYVIAKILPNDELSATTDV